MRSVRSTSTWDGFVNRVIDEINCAYSKGDLTANLLNPYKEWDDPDQLPEFEIWQHLENLVIRLVDEVAPTIKAKRDLVCSDPKARSLIERETLLEDDPKAKVLVETSVNRKHPVQIQCGKEIDVSPLNQLQQDHLNRTFARRIVSNFLDEELDFLEDTYLEELKIEHSKARKLALREEKWFHNLMTKIKRNPSLILEVVPYSDLQRFQDTALALSENGRFRAPERFMDAVWNLDDYLEGKLAPKDVEELYGSEWVR